MTEITIDRERCLRCGRCTRVCPLSLFVGEKGAVPSVERTQSCIGCGHCVDVCAGDCINHSTFPRERIREVQRDLLPSPEQLMELLRSRRSNRAITPQSIPEQAVADMLEAARYAPTAQNSQLIRVTRIDSVEQLQAVEDSTMRFFLRLAKVLMSAPLRPLTKLFLRSLYDEAPELERFEKRWRVGERPCTCNCTTLLVFSAPAGYSFAMHDANLAYQNASLMAEAHGLSQVYMGLVWTALLYQGRRASCRLLALPEGHKVCALMGIGAPAFHYPRYTVR